MSTSLPLPADDTLTPEALQRLHDRPPLNIYRMLGHAPQCVVPFTDTIAALYKGTLSPREREIAILRQAARANAPYEIHQHRFIALANGLTEAEILAITTFTPIPFLTEREKLICAIADQLETKTTLDDPTFDRAQKEFGASQLAELILLISVYCCVARFLNGTRTQKEKTSPLDGHANPN